MSSLLKYTEQRDWVRRFCDNPDELDQAAKCWYEVAERAVGELYDETSCVVSGEIIPEIPVGFRELTDVLSAWCDTQTGIDPSSLRKVCRYLEARGGDVYIDKSNDISFDLAPANLPMAFIDSRDIAERILARQAAPPTAVSLLNDCEQAVLQSLQQPSHLTGEKLAKVAGYPYNANFKGTCSSLVKRGYAQSRAPGYVITPTGCKALRGPKSAQSQD